VPFAGTADDFSPIFIAAVRVRGVAKRDVVFGASYDLGLPNSLLFMAPDDWNQDELFEADVVPIPPPDGEDLWDTVNLGVAAPSELAGRDDLVVVQNDGVHWLFNAGGPGGGFDDDGFGTWPLEAARRMVRSVDLDANGYPDIATYREETLTFVLTEDGPDATTYGFGPTTDFGDGIPDDLVFANLDDDPRPEALILDSVIGGPTAGLRLAANLYPSGALVRPQTSPTAITEEVLRRQLRRRRRDRDLRLRFAPERRPGLLLPRPRGRRAGALPAGLRRPASLPVIGRR
jgi:hypothetical protein